MATRTKSFVSAEEYLAAERHAETKSEYYRGQVLAMAGGTPAHSAIAVSIGAALKQALGGQGIPGTVDVLANSFGGNRSDRSERTTARQRRLFGRGILILQMAAT